MDKTYYRHISNQVTTTIYHTIRFTAEWSMDMITFLKHRVILDRDMINPVTNSYNNAKTKVTKDSKKIILFCGLATLHGCM